MVLILVLVQSRRDSRRLVKRGMGRIAAVRAERASAEFQLKPVVCNI